MRKRVSAVVALTAFLWATTAPAELKYFPLWEEKQCGEPAETFGCYTKDQIRFILEVDEKIQLDMKKLDLAEKNVVDLKLAVEKLEDAKGALEASNEILDGRLREVSRSRDDYAMKWANANDRDVFGGALPWVILVILGAFVGGIVTGIYADR